MEKSYKSYKSLTCIIFLLFRMWKCESTGFVESWMVEKSVGGKSNIILLV